MSSSYVWRLFTCITLCGNTKLNKDKFKQSKLLFHRDHLPDQIKDIVCDLVSNDLLCPDLFRRPGNNENVSKILTSLKSNSRIDLSEYNKYVLANVLKRYMINVHGGVLGEETEYLLIKTLEIENDWERWQEMHQILVKQSDYVKECLSLVLGVWFLMTYHQDNALETHARILTGIAKSVAGSLFPTYATNRDDVDLASSVMENLICSLSTKYLLGVEWIEYFVKTTNCCIIRVEKHTIEMTCPIVLTNEKCRILMDKYVHDVAKKYHFNVQEDETTWSMYQNVDMSIAVHDCISSTIPVARQLIEFVTSISVQETTSSNNQIQLIQRPTLSLINETQIDDGSSTLPTISDNNSIFMPSPTFQSAWPPTHVRPIINTSSFPREQLSSIDENNARQRQQQRHYKVKNDNVTAEEERDKEDDVEENAEELVEGVLQHDYDDVPSLSECETEAMTVTSTFDYIPSPTLRHILSLKTPIEDDSSSTIQQQQQREQSFSNDKLTIVDDYDDVPGMNGQYKVLTRWFVSRHVYKPSDSS